jgi:CheY-like chemotaxis protein
MPQVPKTILVVDDEAFARLFAVQIFLDDGYEVLEAADAEEGMALLAGRDEIALLFTDISMPGDLDGADLIRHARATRPEIAVLATSGHEIGRCGGAVEPSAFLSKPYTAFALQQAIRRVEMRAAA